MEENRSSFSPCRFAALLEMDISPGGELLAFREGKDNTIKVIPVEGGEP